MSLFRLQHSLNCVLKMRERGSEKERERRERERDKEREMELSYNTCTEAARCILVSCSVPCENYITTLLKFW